MTGGRLHAYGDDALADHDAVALAELVRKGSVSPGELTEAAVARARLVERRLRAVAAPAFDAPRSAAGPRGAFFGVPSFVKDNVDVAGLATGHGSEAFRPRPARRDGAYVRQYLSTGVTVLGKSRLPEFGLSASTEFMTAEPTRNPWHTGYSVGASSGGAAALVASGVVPIAHGNDGGGSIRIPAACAGLVGLKPTRHRHVDGEQARLLPINMVSEGVLTRTVRDTAAFVAATEDHWRNPALPPVGLVEGPARRRLRVGLLTDTANGIALDEETRRTVEQTAAVLEKAGHVVEPIRMPVGRQFVDDFVQYWALLADLAASTGRIAFGRSFTVGQLDGLTLGLRAHHRAHLARTPVALARLRRSTHRYAQMFARCEVVLSPVLGHLTPLLGHLSPTVGIDELLPRLVHYIAYTPLNNIAGSPAISVPGGLSRAGLPIGVHLSAAHGDERTLIEVAYLLEAEQPFPSIRRGA